MIAAVVPVKNEQGLPGFVHQVAAWVDNVWVVSDDKELPYEGIQDHARGVNVKAGFGSLGESIALGLRYANYEGVKRVVTIDAGWSHQPHDIPRLIAQDADVVIGSRFCPGGRHEGPWWRSVASQLYGRACTWRTHHRVSDWTSGFRAYSPAAVAVIAAHTLISKRHACQAEFLQVCLDAGLTVREVPITYRVMPGSTMNRQAAIEAFRLWKSFA